MQSNRRQVGWDEVDVRVDTQGRKRHAYGHAAVASLPTKALVEGAVLCCAGLCLVALIARRPMHGSDCLCAKQRHTVTPSPPGESLL
jgi:hypothetical protein